MKNKQAILIGNTRLLVECAELLLAHEWEVLNIFSDDISVINWSKQKKITCLAFSRFKNLKSRDAVLFSVANPHILDAKFLKERSIAYAINYHDSLLPSYGGLYSTTWAIANNEKHHGCTWHLIDEAIDTGRILLQTKIKINSHETAFSLNLKCTEQAILLFKELLANFKGVIDSASIQDTSKRSYYGKNHLPLNYGIVHKINSAGKRLINALYLGPTIDNEITTVKAFYNGKFYIIESLGSQRKLKNIYGEITCDFDINNIDKTVTLNLSDIATIKKWRQYEPLNIAKIRKFDNNNNKILAASQTKVTTKLSDEIECFSPNIETSVTVVNIALANLLNKDVNITLYLSDIREPILAKLFDKFILIKLNLHDIKSKHIDEYVDFVKNAFDNCIILAKDALYRYNLLHFISDLGLAIGEFTEDLPISHRLLINIKEKKIIFEYETSLANLVYYLKHSILHILNLFQSYNNDELKSIGISEIEYINDNLLVEINKSNETTQDFKITHSLYDVFLDTIKNTEKNKIAIIDKLGDYSYDDLYKSSIALAKRIAKDIDSSTKLVAIQTSRGRSQVISMLAILHLGLAYLPLHPEWPEVRVQEIMDASNTVILLIDSVTWGHLSSEFRNSGIKFILVDNDWGCETKIDQNIYYRQNNINDVAYVIFTSGSTGKPKGVTITHKGVLNTIYAINQKFKVNSHDVAISISEISFDLSVYDIFAMLAVGGTVVFPDKSNEILSLSQLIEAHGVTIWNSVPQIACLLLDHTTHAKSIESLRLMLVSGDWVPKDLYAKVSHLIPHTVAYSLGGATEGSIWSIWHKLGTADTLIGYVPYGKAMPNQKMLILNRLQHQLPINMEGDIYIGGDGVALGYWNNEAKTRDSYFNHPKYGYIYKTGDLGSWETAQNEMFIKFMGRMDNQVKIHGFRIELEEIAAKMYEIRYIKQALVLALEHNNNKFLVAYYIAKKKFTKEQLNKSLSATLPSYMLPDFYIQLEQFPLTSNGKIDVSCLPSLTISNVVNVIDEPKTDLEKNLANIIKNITNIKYLGVHDDFFQLGVDSISAIKMSVDISKYLSLHVSANNIFETRTIYNLAKYLTSAALPALNMTNILKQETNNITVVTFPASVLEQRLWLTSMVASPTRSGYAVPIILQLKPIIDMEKLKAAVEQLILRHEALRTTFALDKEGCLQKQIHPQVSCHIVVKNPENEKDFYATIKLDVEERFDLEKSVFRLYHYIIQSTKQQYFLLNVHHISFDGVSCEIVLHDLLTLYNNQIHHRFELSKINLHGTEINKLYEQLNFTTWTYQQQLDYWINELRGFTPLNILKDRNLKDPNDPFAGDNLDFKLNTDLSNKLRNLAKKNLVTLNTVLLSGFALMISRFSNQKDIIISTTMSTRNHQYLNNLIGCFITVCPIRINLFNMSNLSALLKQISTKIFKAYQNQYVSSNDVLQSLNVNYSEVQPFKQIGFALQNFATDIPDSAPFKFITDTAFYKISKFDLDITMNDGQEEITGVVNFPTALYNKDTVETFISSYQYILEQLPLNTQLLKDIRTVPSSHYYPILNFFPDRLKYLNKNSSINDVMLEQGRVNLPAKYLNSCVHEAFIDQAICNPKNTAIIDGIFQIKYHELYRHSNQLAHYLKDLGTRPNTLIAIILDKGWQQVLACLAVMQSGAAYLPIDTSWPNSRILEVLHQGKSDIVIGQTTYLDEDLKENLITSCLHFIEISNTCLWSKENSVHLSRQQTLDDLIYVIFTSGSTGKPKGAMLTHRGVMNSLIDLTYTYKFTSNVVTLSMASLSFDCSVFEMFATLIVGGTIIFPAKNKQKEPLHLIDLIAKYQINTWFSVPVLISMLIEMLPTVNEEKQNQVLTNLDFLFLSGDVLSIALTQKLLHMFPRARIINSGGATEVSVNSLWYPITQIDPKWHSIPYGYAMANQILYVLDDDLNYVPIGVPGDLYIGGIGVGKGYWENEELTNAQFIYHPNLKQIIYKTGDVVSWTKEGYIKYICRSDFQAKVNGYRIELEEVEFYIRQIKDVDEVTALAINGQLVVFIVLVDKTEKNMPTQIKQTLSEKLPPYMVPQTIIVLNGMPRSPNGKINRLELQKIANDPLLNKQNKTIDEPVYQAKNRVEQIIFDIWQNIFIDKIFDLQTNFYSLGGESLKATQIAARLRHSLKIDCSIRDILTHVTIQEQANLIINRLIEKQLSIDMPNVTISDNMPEAVVFEHYPLSYQQAGLAFIAAVEASNIYSMPILFKLALNINLDVFKQSLFAVVKRHEILHTAIRYDSDGNGYQFVMNFDEFDLYCVEIVVKDYAAVETCVASAIKHKFNLANEYPIRFTLVLDMDAQRNYLIIIVHHIVFDGWSAEIFVNEVEAHYNAYQNNLTNERSALNVLPILQSQYKDFAIWQRDNLKNKKLYTILATYWRNKLTGYKNVSLSLDYMRPSHFNYKGKEQTFIIDSRISQVLRNLSRQLNVSLYSTLLGAFVLTLQSFNQQNDIIVGTNSSNRDKREFENLIGFFVNTLPLRFMINENDYLNDFIKKVFMETIEAQEHQELPFNLIVEELNPPRDPSIHPIIQVFFNVQNFVTKNKAEAIPPLMKICNPNKMYGTVFFDLIMTLDDSQDEISANVNYASSLFNPTTIENFIATYLNVLKQIVNVANDTNNSIRIKSLTWLTREVFQTVIYRWNQTNKEYPEKSIIHQLFEEQVEKTPNNIAIVYEDIQLTYQELNIRANQLAYYLRNTYQIRGDDLIALCLARSEYMLIAILAVLKSGGAYVPIDHNYPNERIKYILADTKAKVILANKLYNGKLDQIVSQDNFEANVVIIDSKATQEVIKKQGAANLSRNITSNNLAYVMYTSGTTGNPKGVMIEHKNIINFISDHNINPDKMQYNATFTAPYTFDVSVFDIYSNLLYGSSLYIVTQNTLIDTEKFALFLDKNKINKIYLPANLLKLHLDSIKLRKKQIKYIFTGVEPLDRKVATALTSNDLKLINGYGPTEATVCVTLYKCDENLNNNIIPLGKPLQNMTTYILNEDFTPLPIGVIGELYVGGAGLARGYLNRADLTAERFIANPFQTEKEKAAGKNGRLYKTGDLVRYLPDGNIEYVGRNDFQVKIRGYRIELGEIESVLSSHAGIKQVVVLATEHKSSSSAATIVNATTSNSAAPSNKYLVGYYVADKKLNEEALLKYLAEKLPEYMVPSLLIWVEQLPLTINGKLDRQALPVSELIGTDVYEAPRNAIETKLCQIFAEVLKLPTNEIGINSDFFHLGGNSILAIILMNKVAHVFGKQITLYDFMTLKTIAAIATKLAMSSEKEAKETMLVKLNHVSNKPILCMIHGGHTDTDSYRKLAIKFESMFSCYGINSYNLHHENKIYKLADLATYYISLLQTIMRETGQKHYYLFGWSFGGQVALEMAAQLEKSGNSGITIYLLDTLIKDNYIKILIQKFGIEKYISKYISKLSVSGVDRDYINKITDIIRLEDKMTMEVFSGKIKYSRLYLYKALQLENTDVIIPELANHIKHLKHNNIDKIAQSIQVIPMSDVNHNNILHEEDFLFNNIAATLNKT